MALKGRQYTVTAAAVAPLSTATALNPDYTSNTRPGHIPVQEISFKAPSTNTGTVYIGNSDVTAVPANALIEVAKGTGFTSGPFPHGSVYADDFYVVGTASDVLFIYAVPY